MSSIEIEEQLGYQFKDQDLLREALSHPSLSSETRPAPPDNQRLEYLGDAVIELVISDHLFRRFTDSQEGSLTKLRASIVSKNSLAAAALRLNLGSHLLLSRGEERSGGRERSSNLADTFEALLGALYLDAGMEVTREITLKCLDIELQDLNPKDTLGNTKGELQEILQSITPEAPIYQVIDQSGPPHHRIFTAAVTWKNITLGQGEGPSKKIAEIAAATEALNKESWKQSS